MAMPKPWWTSRTFIIHLPPPTYDISIPLSSWNFECWPFLNTTDYPMKHQLHVFFSFILLVSYYYYFFLSFLIIIMLCDCFYYEPPKMKIKNIPTINNFVYWHYYVSLRTYRQWKRHRNCMNAYFQSTASLQLPAHAELLSKYHCGNHCFSLCFRSSSSTCFPCVAIKKISMWKSATAFPITAFLSFEIVVPTSAVSIKYVQCIRRQYH